VGSGDDESIGDQRTTAEEHPVQGDGHLPGVLANVRLVAANNPPVVAVPEFFAPHGVQPFSS